MDSNDESSRAFSEAPLAQALIDQAIEEYEPGEKLAYRFAITLFLVGIAVLAYGAWVQQGIVALAGSVTTSLFIPAMSYLSRVRREKTALPIAAVSVKPRAQQPECRRRDSKTVRGSVSRQEEEVSTEDRFAQQLQKLAKGLRAGTVRQFGMDLPFGVVRKSLTDLGCIWSDEAHGEGVRRYRKVTRLGRETFVPEAREDELVAAEWISAVCLSLGLDIADFYRIASEDPTVKRPVSAEPRDTKSTVGPAGLTEEENARCRQAIERHERVSQSLLSQKDTLAYFGIHSIPEAPVNVAGERIQRTFGDPNVRYAEYLKFAPEVETHPDGYSRRYRIRGEETTQAATCYRDGSIVSEGYLDTFLEGKKRLNPLWFIYELQRHFQLTREVLDGLTSEVLAVVTFSNLEGCGWEVYGAKRVESVKLYRGYHRDITCVVQLGSIPERERWNVTADAAVEILREVARVFGMDELPQDYWDADRILKFAQYAPGSR